MTEPTQTFTVNVNPEALRLGELALQQELQTIEALEIDTPEMALVLGQVLIEQLKTLDAMQTQRDRVTKPLHAGWKNTCELFAPGLELQGKICRALKDKQSVWYLQLAQAKQQATLEARAALETGDVATIDRALAIVNDTPTLAAGVSVALVWKIKRVLPDLLLPQYLCPDMAAIEREAARQGVKGDEPPVIPGVVFEREAPVTGRRK